MSLDIPPILAPLLRAVYTSKSIDKSLNTDKTKKNLIRKYLSAGSRRRRMSLMLGNTCFTRCGVMTFGTLA